MTIKTDEVTSKEKEIVNLETALIVVEEPPAPEVIEVPMPKRFQVWVARKDNDPIPRAKHPFYAMYKEGLFLYRRLLIGDGYVPHKFIPQTLPTIGEDRAGVFWWTAPKIPANICAQIVTFFKRIYEKQHTEAEVLLLLNRKTMEWKVWVPTQMVSHTGVKSVYEPADLPKDFILVGSMHSHCNFDAFHSSTDTGDAEDFDGVHLTVGHILDEHPQVVAMVMMNKVKFDYGDVSEVADFSDMFSEEAPEFWDDFVTEVTSQNRPKGFGLFEKYAPPKAVVPYTGRYSGNNYGHKPWVPPVKTDIPTDSALSDWLDDDYMDWRYGMHTTKRPIQSMFDDKDEHWEDGLPQKFVDLIMDSSTIQDKDIDYVVENPLAGMSLLHWRNLYIQKMSDAANVLNSLGIDVSYHLNPKKFAPEGDK